MRTVTFPAILAASVATITTAADLTAQSPGDAAAAVVCSDTPAMSGMHAPGDAHRDMAADEHARLHAQHARQSQDARHTRNARPSEVGVDSAFAALQSRGRVAMGVDQYTSTHRFDILPDGGRIELQRDVEDADGVAVIRDHLRGIADAFARGDFCTPAFVHDRPVPGTVVMAARKDRIEYEFRELPRGGEIRITTSDPEALEAIRAFMRFQRSDHRAGGHGG